MANKRTVARGIRISEDLEEWIGQRAARRRWSFNRWINWAILQGLRSHKSRNKVL